MNRITLAQWMHQCIDVPQARVRTKLRGNDLHILFEHQPCVEASVVTRRLKLALAETSLDELLPGEASPVYRIVVYGRLPNQAKPMWTESFYLNPLNQRVTMPSSIESYGQEPAGNTALRASATVPTRAITSILTQAREGEPDAIARYLSDHLSDRGIAIRARLDSPRSEPTPSDSDGSTTASALPLQRLFVICESAYSPDPLLLAEPIAQKLRDLRLSGFQDAIVFGQVKGEAKPDWALRVDLTPPETVLSEWARWGDVQAITRLFNHQLQQLQVSALLKEGVLHLTCRNSESTVPDQSSAIASIVPLLETLSPQGIRAAMIYGFAGETAPADLLNASATPVPQWVHWLDLASTHPQGTSSTLELAQQGNTEAITFLLTRLLNPNLDSRLATGGMRIQIRQKADLLHIMSDALTCPLQSQVGPAIARFLKPLQIPGVTGVRIYGRRSGQKQPLWSYGVDFVRRDRLVPEATPEFAVSDAYVGDLFSPPGALVLRADSTATTSRSLLVKLFEGGIQRLQRSLLWSQLFLPLEAPQLSSVAAGNSGNAATPAARDGSVALVWGAVGLLLVVQVDWLSSHWLLRPAAPISPQPILSPPPSSPVVAQPVFPPLARSKPNSKTSGIFNTSGFTQQGTETADSVQPSPSSNTTPALTATVLPASVLQPQASSLLATATPYPTFNSHQLDEKVALYQAFVAQYGSPDILVVGSSRALRGIDPVALQKDLAEQGYPGTKIFNFGINGATAQVVNLVIRQILPQDKLPKLILWADGARAFNSGRDDVTFNGILASEGYKTLVAGQPPVSGSRSAQAPDSSQSPKPAQLATTSADTAASLSGGYHKVNQELNQWLGMVSTAYTQRDRLKTQLRDQLASLLSPDRLAMAFGGVAPNHFSDATSPAASAANTPAPVLSEGQMLVDVNGFLPLSNRFNPATYYQKYARVPGDYDSDYESFSLEGKQTQALAELVQFTQAKQIPLVFVNLPLTKDYLDPTRKQYEEQFQQHMLQVAPQLSFVYRDLSQAFSNQPDYFSDPSHLNRYGAYAVSHKLAMDALIPWGLARK